MRSFHRSSCGRKTSRLVVAERLTLKNVSRDTGIGPEDPSNTVLDRDLLKTVVQNIPASGAEGCDMIHQFHLKPAAVAKPSCPHHSLVRFIERYFLNSKMD